jgi:hypothetical protein
MKWNFLLDIYDCLWLFFQLQWSANRGDGGRWTGGREDGSAQGSWPGGEAKLCHPWQTSPGYPVIKILFLKTINKKIKRFGWWHDATLFVYFWNSFIRRHSLWFLSISSSLISWSGKKPPWGSEPSIELGPALQQGLTHYQLSYAAPCLNKKVIMWHVF